MNKPPHYWNKAKKYLSKKDKVMSNLIRKYNDKTLITRNNIFFSLCNISPRSLFLYFRKIFFNHLIRIFIYIFTKYI